MKKVISIITPCFNEENGIFDCYYAIKKIFDSELKAYNREHIFCDNSSSDNTINLLRKIAETDKSVKVILNSRNFGILKNTFNGVINSNGDAIVLFMPVDLQDPPELIPQFVKKWEEGFEIVYGIRAKREENFFIASLRKIYYRLLSKLTYVDYPPDVGDFQLIDKKVLDVMKKIEDAQPFMRLMTFDCGFKKVGIPYTWRFRKYGKSQNSFLDMIRQGLNGIVSYSGAPLRLSLILGSVISLFSLIYAIGVFTLFLLGYRDAQTGVPTLIVALFFFGGVQLLFLGILGEYILAIYNQVRKKPLVVERERINF
jgi:glycosyltransferase involved in cell wall biosynthesis